MKVLFATTNSAKIKKYEEKLKEKQHKKALGAFLIRIVLIKMLLTESFFVVIIKTQISFEILTRVSRNTVFL